MYTDNYILGVDILEKVLPTWGKYCSFANRGEFEYHEVASKIQNIINCMQKWLIEKEPNTLLRDFLVAFEALAHDCINFIGFKYRTRTVEPKKSSDIVGRLVSYRKTAGISEIKQEINRHIENGNTPSEIEQYITSLLLPFKEVCDVFRPLTPSDESQLFIKLLCTSKINHEKETPGTVEYCLRCLLNDMNDYALGLYNVLILNGIDLNEYQKRTGVFFRKEWNPAKNGMFFNVGDWDLVENLAFFGRNINKAQRNAVDEDVSADTDQKKSELEAKKKQHKKRVDPAVVNEKEFKKYFTLSFCNLGQFAYLVSDIKDIHTIKDCSTVAKMIYDSSNVFVNSFTTFASWCRVFFKCIGVGVTEKYNYSKWYEPSAELKRKFYYLG